MIDEGHEEPIDALVRVTRPFKLKRRSIGRGRQIGKERWLVHGQDEFIVKLSQILWGQNSIRLDL